MATVLHLHYVVRPQTRTYAEPPLWDYDEVVAVLHPIAGNGSCAEKDSIIAPQQPKREQRTQSPPISVAALRLCRTRGAHFHPSHVLLLYPENDYHQAPCLFA